MVGKHEFDLLLFYFFSYTMYLEFRLITATGL